MSTMGKYFIRQPQIYLLYLNTQSMEIEHYNSDMIKPEIVIEILAKNGIHVSIEEAKNILELLYFLVNLSIDQYVNT